MQAPVSDDCAGLIGLTFLDAFEAVYSLKEHFESDEEADDAKLQILYRYCSGLSKLYGCCKHDELGDEC